MFATLINQISTNAGQKLAFTHAGIFYVRKHFSTTLYRCPDTPVYRLNGRTAFVDECDKQRVRSGHLLFYSLCYSTSTFPMPHCLAATGRQPTKRAPLLRTIPTPFAFGILNGKSAAASQAVPPTYGKSSVLKCCALTRSSAASACVIQASASLPPCVCTPANVSIAKPATLKICTRCLSQLWNVNKASSKQYAVAYNPSSSGGVARTATLILKTSFTKHFNDYRAWKQKA